MLAPTATFAFYLLAKIGFVANATQSASTMHWISLFFTVILGAGAIAAILPLLKYELHEHRYSEIVAELNHRKAKLTDPMATDPQGHGTTLS